MKGFAVLSSINKYAPTEGNDLQPSAVGLAALQLCSGQAFGGLMGIWPREGCYCDSEERS
jgi:hypothetical protein